MIAERFLLREIITRSLPSADSLAIELSMPKAVGVKVGSARRHADASRGSALSVYSTQEENLGAHWKGKSRRPDAMRSPSVGPPVHHH